MGKVKINEEYYVDVFERCLTLRKLLGTKINKKTGIEEPLYSTGWDYTSWDGVFFKLLRISEVERFNKNVLTELKELRSIFNENKKEILSMIKDIDSISIRTID